MAIQKIVSLVPSLTELMVDLGLHKELVGRTRFCVHPKKVVADIPIIGGTKNPNVEAIRKLSPDLVIASKEENRQEDVEAIRRFSEVLVTDIQTISDALLAIHDVGSACGKQEKAAALIENIQDELERLPDAEPLRVCYLIWRDPWMTIGGDTYIHDVLGKWHFENVFGEQNRYPELSLDDIAQEKPDLVLLSSEPYPFKEAHLKEVGDACNASDVMLVNGEWFSWYGSRMLPSFRKLNMFRKAIS
ncbi:MAG: helical backbone metal receptor [Balneolaceae bacterium]